MTDHKTWGGGAVSTCNKKLKKVLLFGFIMCPAQKRRELHEFEDT